MNELERQNSPLIAADHMHTAGEVLCSRRESCISLKIEFATWQISAPAQFDQLLRVDVFHKDVNYSDKDIL